MTWFARLRRLSGTLGRDVLVLWHACRDPAVPRSLRLMALGLLLYTVSPLDLIPDFLTLFGLADDIALVMLGIPFLLRRVPADALARASLRADQMLARWGFRGRGRRNGTPL